MRRRVAVLIGFSYNELPGILVDIYRIYQFLQPAFTTPTSSITIITDIEKDPPANIYLRPIASSIVDANIISFISDLKVRGQYHRFQGKENLLPFLRKRVAGKGEQEDFFFYYTGHAKVDCIHLPSVLNGDDCPAFAIDRILTTELREILYEERGKEDTILSILDCCEIQGVDLPFTLDINGFYRRNSFYFGLPRFICITPRHHYQWMASGLGSIFTSRLIEELMKRKRRLQDLTEFSTVTTTYPTLSLLWGWIFSPLFIQVKKSVETETLQITIG